MLEGRVGDPGDGVSHQRRLGTHNRHLPFMFNLAILYKFMINIPGMGLQAKYAWFFQRLKQEARRSEMA